MPVGFKKCVREGGRVRTIKHGQSKYQHVCVRPKEQKGPRGGRTVGGEVKTKKEK